MAAYISRYQTQLLVEGGPATPPHNALLSIPDWHLARLPASPPPPPAAKPVSRRSHEENKQTNSIYPCFSERVKLLPGDFRGCLCRSAYSWAEEGFLHQIYLRRARGRLPGTFFQARRGQPREDPAVKGGRGAASFLSSLAAIL